MKHLCILIVIFFAFQSAVAQKRVNWDKPLYEVSVRPIAELLSGERQSYMLIDGTEFAITDTLIRYEYCGDTVIRYEYCGDTVKKVFGNSGKLISWNVKKELPISKKARLETSIYDNGWTEYIGHRYKRKSIIELDTINGQPYREKRYYSDKDHKHLIRSASVLVYKRGDKELRQSTFGYYDQHGSPVDALLADAAFMDEYYGKNHIVVERITSSRYGKASVTYYYFNNIKVEELRGFPGVYHPYICSGYLYATE